MDEYNEMSLELEGLLPGFDISSITKMITQADFVSALSDELNTHIFTRNTELGLEESDDTQQVGCIAMLLKYPVGIDGMNDFRAAYHQEFDVQRIYFDRTNRR